MLLLPEDPTTQVALNALMIRHWSGQALHSPLGFQRPKGRNRPLAGLWATDFRALRVVQTEVGWSRKVIAIPPALRAQVLERPKPRSP